MVVTARNPFTAKPAISDNQIFAIGAVCYQWSQLENHIDMWIKAATGSSFDSGKGQRTSFGERVRHLRSVVSTSVSEPWKAQIDRVLGLALDQKGQRDRVVHWQWGVDERERPGVANWVAGKPDVWSVDYGRVIKIAKDSEALTLSLQMIILENGRNDANSMILLSQAWKKICQPVSP